MFHLGIFYIKIDTKKYLKSFTITVKSQTAQQHLQSLKSLSKFHRTDLE
jgi:hypothetical protein